MEPAPLLLSDAQPPAQPSGPPVPQGPRAYRGRIRRLGPIAALVPPALLAALGWLLHHHNTGAVRGVASFFFAVLAAPVLLVAGVPLSHGGGVYLLSALASAALWCGIGAVAAFRATRRPAATWRDFWREYLWLAGGVWLGVVGALVAADLVLGRGLV